MATTTLEQVVKKVKALKPDERRQLRAMLDALLDAAATDEDEVQRKEDELKRRLLAKGIVSRIPPPITDPRPYDDWEPVEIEGEPLSETIIRERR